MSRGKKRRGNRKFHKKRSSRHEKLKVSKEPVEIKVTPIGLFAFHEGKQIKKELWGKNPENNAQTYMERDEKIKKFSSSINIKAKRNISGVFGENLEKLAEENGFKKEEFRSFFQKFMLELTKLKLKKGFSKDKLIKQAVESLDETNRMINKFYERLREWYGFYAPEKIESVESMEEFAKIVGKKREGKSMGFDLEEEDLQMIKVAGEEMASLVQFKEKLTNYIEELMEEFAINLSKVAGPVLGAKLISISGSLEKLARLPSSTIQLLGAEKALFRHLRKGTKPPKYGVVLQHRLMAKVPFKKRGKFARMIAAKSSIAAKVDFYSKGQEKWEELVEELEEKANEA